MLLYEHIWAYIGTENAEAGTYRSIRTASKIWADYPIDISNGDFPSQTLQHKISLLKIQSLSASTDSSLFVVQIFCCRLPSNNIQIYPSPINLPVEQEPGWDYYSDLNFTFPLKKRNRNCKEKYSNRLAKCSHSLTRYLSLAPVAVSVSKIPDIETVFVSIGPN